VGGWSNAWVGERVLWKAREGFGREFQSGVNMKNSESIGIGMESDATPWSVIKGVVEGARQAIANELINLIEKGKVNLSNPGPDIKKAVENVEKSIELHGWDFFWAAVGSFLEGDDKIGIQHGIYIAGDPALKGLTSIELLKERTLQINFEGDGAHYRVNGSIRKFAWSQWFGLGGEIQDAPAALYPSPGQIELYARGMDNRLWQKWYDGKTWLDGWHLHDDSDIQLGSAPVVLTDGKGFRDVYIRGQDGVVYHKFWRP
jgi:hypothetical protein